MEKAIHGFNGQGWKRNEYKISFPEGSDTESPRQKGGDTDDIKVVTHSHTNSPYNSPNIYIKDLENWTPPDALVEKLKFHAIPWDEEILTHFRLHYSNNQRLNFNPESAFFNWCRNERGYQRTKGQKKASLWNKSDREIMKLAEEAGIRTQGKSKQELIARLESV